MNSRRKGANGEREYRNELRAAGFVAERDGGNREHTHQDLVHNIPGVHLEVKRRETLAIPAWCRQAERDARGRVPVIAFRQSKQPWRVVAPSAWFLGILRELIDLRAEVARLREESLERSGGW